MQQRKLLAADTVSIGEVFFDSIVELSQQRH